MFIHRLYDDLGLNDPLNNDQVVIPNYDRLTLEIRIGLRKAQYLSMPENETSLKSITGELLHEDLLNLYQNSVNVRNADILNVIRYSDFSQGYNYENGHLPIFLDKEKGTVTLASLNTQIEIILEVMDPELKLSATTAYLSCEDKVSAKSLFLSQLIETFD